MTAGSANQETLADQNGVVDRGAGSWMLEPLNVIRGMLLLIPAGDSPDPKLEPSKKKLDTYTPPFKLE